MFCFNESRYVVFDLDEIDIMVFGLKIDFNFIFLLVFINVFVYVIINFNFELIGLLELIMLKLIFWSDV